MGFTIVSQVSPPTNLEIAKRQYVDGVVSLQEFEDIVEAFLWAGTEGDPHWPSLIGGLPPIDK